MNQTKIKTYLTVGGKAGYKPSERMDCAVRAYSIVCEVPYIDAYELFNILGRNPNRSTSTWIIACVFARHSLVIQHEENRWKGTTLIKWLEVHPRGRYFVYNRNHAFAVIDGVVFDDKRHTGHTKVYSFVKVS